MSEAKGRIEALRAQVEARREASAGADRTEQVQALRAQVEARREASAGVDRTEQVQAARAQVASQVEALRARREARRESGGGTPERTDRRRWVRWVVYTVVAVIILLLLRPCQCTPDPVGEEGIPVQVVAPEPEPEPVVVPEAPPPPVESPRIPRRDRPELEPEPPGPAPWVSAFRMQVMARGPRLAECFEGAEAPGRLKWSTAVEPVQGTVGEHELEPMLDGVALGRRERRCVLDVLSRPAYRLDVEEGAATPVRVGMVIAF